MATMFRRAIQVLFGLIGSNVLLAQGKYRFSFLSIVSGHVFPGKEIGCIGTDESRTSSKESYIKHYG